MQGNCLLQQCKSFRLDLKYLSVQGSGKSSCAAPVVRIPALVLATAVVQNGEEANDILIGTGPIGQFEANLFDAPPMGGAMERMRAKLEDFGCAIHYLIE